LRAGFDIGLMNFEDGVAVGDVELVHTALRADGFIEQRAHRAVSDQDYLAESFVEIFNAHGFLLFAGGVPGREPDPLLDISAAGKKFVIIPFVVPRIA
jgi:hypothetical protein